MKEHTGRTFLVVIAHPDDAELTVDGTIARLVREGNRAILVVATDAARGGKLPGSVLADVARVRRAEQVEAAAVIGYDEVVFLGFPDGHLEDSNQLRGALVRQIRHFQPAVAIFMDPLTVIYRNSYVNHRDHRVLGMAMLDALYPQASNAGYFPEHLQEGLTLHKVPETWLAQSDHPNYWVDVGETLDIRFAALRRHESQMGLWPDAGEEIIRQQRAFAEVQGVEHGMRYAESFRRIVVNPLA